MLYRALSYDQMGSAHPIHNPTIHTYRDPDSVFTVISYDKVRQGSPAQQRYIDTCPIPRLEASFV